MAVNKKLLKTTMKYIENHPEDWDQGEWRCRTGMCFAGWACTLGGLNWLKKNPDSPKGDHVITPTGSMQAEEAARLLLGLDHDTADTIFAAGINLGELRDRVDDLVKD